MVHDSFFKMSTSKNDQRARRWVATVQNPTEDWEHLMNDLGVEYAIIGMETAPSTGENSSPIHSFPPPLQRRDRAQSITIRPMSPIPEECPHHGYDTSDDNMCYCECSDEEEERFAFPPSPPKLRRTRRIRPMLIPETPLTRNPLFDVPFSNVPAGSPGPLGSINNPINID